MGNALGSLSPYSCLLCSTERGPDRKEGQGGSQVLWASRWPRLASTQTRTPQVPPGSSQLSSSTGTPSSSPSLKPAWLKTLGTSVLSSASLDHLGIESCCPALSPLGHLGAYPSPAFTEVSQAPGRNCHPSLFSGSGESEAQTGQMSEVLPFPSPVS